MDNCGGKTGDGAVDRALGDAVVKLLLGHEGAAKALLAMGAGPMDPVEGMPLFHMAVGLSQDEAALANLFDLLDAGADPDAPDSDGHSLLRKIAVSARPGWEDLAIELCRRGADPDAGGSQSCARGLLEAWGYSSEAKREAEDCLGMLRAHREKALLGRQSPAAAAKPRGGI